MTTSGDRSEPDRWASWLIHERDGPDGGYLRELNERFLNEVCYRVLKLAQVKAGDAVVDVGAGTGLLAHEASNRVGSDGSVVTLDLSLDALVECRRTAPHESRLRLVRGDATLLPFPDNTFDVVVSRSVLMYVAEKQHAVDEMFRVLRPGGRVSVFEPINSVVDLYGFREAMPPRIASMHDRVQARFAGLSESWQSMMTFDERDLVRLMMQAGFSTIGLAYEFLTLPYELTENDARLSMTHRGSPTSPTWQEAAQAALGSDAGEYLDDLCRLRAATPRHAVSAVAYLTARRARS